MVTRALAWTAQTRAALRRRVVRRPVRARPGSILAEADLEEHEAHGDRARDADPPPAGDRGGAVAGDRQHESGDGERQRREEAPRRGAARVARARRGAVAAGPVVRADGDPAAVPGGPGTVTSPSGRVGAACSTTPGPPPASPACRPARRRRSAASTRCS